MQKLIEFYKYPEATCRSYHGDVTDDTIQALEELAALRDTIEEVVTILKMEHDMFDATMKEEAMAEAVRLLEAHTQ